MTLLNWLPEIAVLASLFVTLVLVNFRILTLRAIAPFAALTVALTLGYFAIRTDLAYFESPLPVLHSDSLSYFGRLLSLAAFSVFSMGFFFHGSLSVRDKQLTTLFLLFLSLFVSLLFQANHLVLFVGSAIGIYFCSANLILIESGKSQDWVRLFRQRTMGFGVWVLLLSILFVLSTHLSGSTLIHEWVSGAEAISGPEVGIWLTAVLVLLGAVIPLEVLSHSGKAPVGLGILYFGLHLVIHVFWLRIGTPFFSKGSVPGKQQAQILIALLFGAYTLRYAYQAVRAREHHRWFSSALPVVLGLGFFLNLLPSDKVLPAFFSISFALIPTIALISHAFLDEAYRQKGLVSGALIAIMGVPPLVLGDQYYRLIHDVVHAGNLVAGVLMILSWFGLVIAVIQIMGKVLLVRNGAKDGRSIHPSEWFFIALYLLCVISLTALRPALVPLLNEHPLLNLW